MLRVANLLKNFQIFLMIDCVYHDTFRVFFARQINIKIDFDDENEHDKNVHSNENNFIDQIEINFNVKNKHDKNDNLNKNNDEKMKNFLKTSQTIFRKTIVQLKKFHMKKTMKKYIN